MYSKEEIEKIFASAKSLEDLELILDTFSWLIEKEIICRSTYLYEIAKERYSILTKKT